MREPFGSTSSNGFDRRDDRHCGVAARYAGIVDEAGQGRPARVRVLPPRHQGPARRFRCHDRQSHRLTPDAWTKHDLRDFAFLSACDVVVHFGIKLTILLGSASMNNTMALNSGQPSPAFQGNESRLTKSRSTSENGFLRLNPNANRLGLRAASFWSALQKVPEAVTDDFRSGKIARPPYFCTLR
jgi:hypothetical protein